MPFYIPFDKGFNYFRESIDDLVTETKSKEAIIKEFNLVFSDFESGSSFYNEEGICLYRVQEGKIIKKTEEELLPEKEAYNKALLADYKIGKIEACKQYASSPEVDRVSLNGYKGIVAFKDRGKLQEKIEISEALGEENLSFTFAGQDITFPISTWKKIRIAIIVRATKNYNKCQEHIKAIEELTSIEAVNSYDFTLGYESAELLLK